MDGGALAPEEWLALNRALWDERVPIHVAPDGTYRLPEGTPSLPLMYSLLGSKVRA